MKPQFGLVLLVCRGELGFKEARWSEHWLGLIWFCFSFNNRMLLDNCWNEWDCKKAMGEWHKLLMKITTVTAKIAGFKFQMFNWLWLPLDSFNGLNMKFRVFVSYNCFPYLFFFLGYFHLSNKIATVKFLTNVRERASVVWFDFSATLA